MNTRLSIRAVLGVALLATAPGHAKAAVPATSCAAHASAVLDALVRGDDVAAGKDFAPSLAAQLDAATLAKVWSTLQAQAGRYVSHDAAQGAYIRDQPVTVTPVHFAKVPLGMVVQCDGSSRITTLRFAPQEQLALAIQKSAPVPVRAHVEADGVRVQPMAVVSPLGPLKGVLTLPPGKGPFPAVVMVAGSGAHDFDETVGPNKPFRDLAEGLARAGVASLRYDKRPYDYSDWGTKGGYNVDAEVTDDAVTAAHALSALKAIDPRRVYVLGHSLGAMMAPRIGQRDPQLAGLILLAAPARSLLDVLIQQFHEQDPPKVATRKIEALRHEQKLLAQATPGQPPRGTFFGQPQSYWQSLNDYHQVALARSLGMPMLFLQGDADFQVSPTLDFAVWKRDMAGTPTATFDLYPGLGHLFMPAAQTGSDYSKPSHVDPRVIRDIAAWIGRR